MSKEHVVYVGPRDAVTIAETGKRAVKGEPVAVPADLAARLCEQPQWQPATAPKAPQAPKSQDAPKGAAAPSDATAAPGDNPKEG